MDEKGQEDGGKEKKTKGEREREREGALNRREKQLYFSQYNS